MMIPIWVQPVTYAGEDEVPRFHVVCVDGEGVEHVAAVDRVDGVARFRPGQPEFEPYARDILEAARDAQWPLDPPSLV